MTPDRWVQIRAVVEEAMLLPASERPAYLKSLMLDEELRADTEQLLAFENDASEMFSLDGWKIWADPSSVEENLAGQLVGNYKLIEVIGRGGMGTVYRAERADGEFQKQVAIKVLQESIFTASLVKRFRDERQILAGLSHPGIAQLLDGGITLDRRPYLVLEYVHGRPIDRYCVEENLSVASKLRLFLAVAEAVQSAHQQMVLHLDLKPANIIVSDTGEPRLLDFGISRLLSESENGAQEAEVTMRLLTPRYASPEQAMGAPLGVASDVFSLATLLYKLLTGRLPYPVEDAAPLEAARMIREVEPVPPSMAAPAKIASELRGDIDIILLHALRKEPNRRYSTVAAFADDVQRHLGSRPIVAHADSPRYRIGKFLRRNRIASIATAAMVMILAASVAAVTHSDMVAQRERSEAERERATAERRLGDVRSLANSYITELIPELEDIPGTLKVRSQVMKRALGYLEAMSKEQTSDPTLERELALGYYTMGKLQGDSYSTSLGDRQGGWDSLNRSLAIQRRIAAKNPVDLKDRARLMTTLRVLANMRVSQGDIVGGQALHRESWEAGQPILAEGPKSAMYLDVANSAWFMSMSFSGDGVWNLAMPDEGLQWARHSEEILSRYFAANPTAVKNVRFTYQLATTKAAEADALMLLGRSDEAIALYQQIVPVLDRKPLAPDVLSLETRRYMHQRYARLLVARGNLAEATRVSAILRPSERKEMGESGNDLWGSFAMTDTIGWTAIMDWRNGHTAQAQEEMRACLESYRALRDSEPDLMWPTVGLTYYLLDFAELPQINTVQAEAMYREADTLAQEYAADHPQMLSARLLQARAHLGLERAAHSAHRLADAQREADAIRTLIQPVLAARPGLLVAQQMLAAADASAKI